jgi:protein required for attachment to host cells
MGFMMLEGSTLVVVADGALARFSGRTRLGARLVELIDKRMLIDEAAPERDRAPRINDRFGGGRHKIEHRLTAHEAAEEAFLADVASRIETTLRQDEAARLVLCAPPKALGLLRKALPEPARERLTLSLHKDLTKETPAAIGQRLRDLRV